MEGCSRRAYLRHGAAALAAGLAGCARLGVELTPTPEPTGTYLDWLPAPSAVRGERYRVRTLSRASVRAHRDALHPATRKLLRRERVWRRFRPLSTELSGAERLLRAGPGRVYLGVDTGGLESYLFEKRYDKEPAYGRFEVYEKRPLGFELYPFPEVVAVGDGVVVTSVRPADATMRPRRAVELVVDARGGDAPRFHGESEDHRLVADHLAGATLGVAAVPAVNPPLGGVTVFGYGWTVGPEVTAFRGALTFEDAADARVADLDAYGRSVAPDHREWTTEQSGRTGTLRAEIPTGRFDAGYPGDPGADGVPDVTFAVEPADDGDRADVGHAGGQPVAAQQLTVTVDGDPAAAQFADAHDEVQEGDRITVETDGLAVVEVHWTAPGGAASLLLTRAAAR
jgi:hypothetical protein